MTPNDVTRLVLSVVVTFGFGAAVMAWMVWPPVAATNVAILTGLTASLGTGYIQVISYWFQKSSAP